MPTLNPLAKDNWHCLGQGSKYSSMKMYKNISEKTEVHSIFSQLWKTACRLRHKIFFWLLLHDRISTRNMLQHRSMYLESYNCALCGDGTEETSLHRFWDCPYAWTCWNILTPSKVKGISTYDEILVTLDQLPTNIAMEIVILGCWSIWLTRNDKIFRQAPIHLGTWKFYLKESLEITTFWAKQERATMISNWIPLYL